MESEKKLTFADQVRAIPGGELFDICYSCGTCVSRCLVQQKVEKTYNPRRMMKMVSLDMREAAFEQMTTWLCSACELCYPACPQEIHISGVINAVKQLAVESGVRSPLQVAQVDEKTCVGCSLCVQVCPYQAIQLVEKNLPNRGGKMMIAEVNSALCMACGLCASMCRSASIYLPAQNHSQQILGALSAWLVEKAEVENA